MEELEDDDDDLGKDPPMRPAVTAQAGSHIKVKHNSAPNKSGNMTF